MLYNKNDCACSAAYKIVVQHLERLGLIETSPSHVNNACIAIGWHFYYYM